MKTELRGLKKNPILFSVGLECDVSHKLKMVLEKQQHTPTFQFDDYSICQYKTSPGEGQSQMNPPFAHQFVSQSCYWSIMDYRAKTRSRLELGTVFKVDKYNHI